MDEPHTYYEDTSSVSYDKEGDMLRIIFETERIDEILDSVLTPNTDLIIHYDSNNRVLGVDVLNLSALLTPPPQESGLNRLRDKLLKDPKEYEDLILVFT